MVEVEGPAFPADFAAEASGLQRRVARDKRPEAASRLGLLCQRLGACPELAAPAELLVLLGALHRPRAPRRVVEPALVAGAGPAAGAFPASAERRGQASQRSLPQTVEQALCRDVLFVCQGLDGRYVKFAPGGGNFTIEMQAPHSAQARALVRKLCEAGWLHRKLAAFCEEDAVGSQRFTAQSDRAAPGRGRPPSAAEGGSPGPQGTVAQAFQATLRREMHRHSRVLALLQAQLSGGNDGAPGGGGGGGGEQVTLRRLALWLAEPTQTLKVLAVLAEKAQGLRGGALAGELFKYAEHGDPFVQATVSRVLEDVCAPLLTLLSQWLSTGELEDPHGEFFVAQDPAATPSDLWEKGYRLVPEHVPPFIRRRTAELALRAGKSINFLRRCCRDAAGFAGWEDRAAAWSAERFRDRSSLDAAVQLAAEETDKLLMEVMFDQFHFSRHCLALKQYLLLGQGDFVQCLMDQVGPQLGARAGSLSVYKLNSAFDAAVRASCAQHAEPEILDCLGVALMPHTPEESGWDAFSLAYKVTQPLDTVLTREAMGKYLRIFNFLWRLKRVEHALSATWQDMKPSSPAVHDLLKSLGGGAARDLGCELRRCHVLRNDMAHFCTTLQYYIMFEVLEDGWGHFVRRMSSATNLDALVEAHADYLDTVLEKALLGPQSQPLVRQLGAIFELVLQFKGFASRLQEMLQQAANQRRLQAMQARTSETAGQWGPGGGGGAGGPPSALPQGFADSIRTELDSINRDYAHLLESFVGLFPLVSHLDLRSLLFQLDLARGGAPGGAGAAGSRASPHLLPAFSSP